MSDPLCPYCKAHLTKVRPVRIKADPDTRRWVGPVPAAVGFTCMSCNGLLPLTSIVDGT